MIRFASRAGLIFFALTLVLPMPLSSQNDPFADERTQMVEEQLLDRGITDASVLRAMHTVPRHHLVPPDLVQYAYTDRPLPIGYDQTISQPFIVAYMVQAAELQSTDRVLEIGTGSGYQAAVLAEIVDSVYTIEIVEPLGRTAKRRLEELGYDNIAVRIGDGYAGWPEAAPFDAILVTAAPEDVPPPLAQQLAEGGRMIIPVGKESRLQYLMQLEKRNGKLKQKKLLPVRFVPFTRH